MTTEILRQKTSRYLYGSPMPAEAKQIQYWLSSTGAKKATSEEERTMIEEQILEEIKSYTAYPLFFPKKDPWWKKLV